MRKTASAFEDIRLVVTHPGRAHRDDLYACAILLAVAPAAMLERRVPTPEELSDESVAIVDVGGIHDPALSNFDHHQFDPALGDATLCTLTLVLRAFGWESLARIVWPWLEPLEWQDSRGPRETAGRFTPGTSWKEGLGRAASPADAWLGTVFKAGDTETLRHFGRHLLRELRAADENFALLDSLASWHTIRGLTVLDTRRVRPPGGLSSLHANAWISQRARTPVIVVGASEREENCNNLVRFHDHPAVDFRRLKGEPDVRFIHANGFLACVKASSETRLLELLATGIAGDAGYFGETACHHHAEKISVCTAEP